MNIVTLYGHFALIMSLNKNMGRIEKDVQLSVQVASDR